MAEYFNTLLTDTVSQIGLMASIIVLVSMCFNPSTKSGNLLMRGVNLIGSIISVVYGLMLGPLGAGMILLNGVLVFVNAYYLIVTLKHK